MCKKGYILHRKNNSDFAQDIAWMKKYGCVSIAEEHYMDESDRPMLHLLISTLGYGDELVVSSCSTLFRSMRTMGIYFEMFQNLNIRFISIHDRLDSRDELFPETTAGNMISILGNLSYDIHEMRKRNGYIRVEKNDGRTGITYTTKEKKKIEARAINMYMAHYHIDDILEECQYGNRTKLYRVLRKYDIMPNRKRHIPKAPACLLPSDIGACLIPSENLIQADEILA